MSPAGNPAAVVALFDAGVAFVAAKCQITEDKDKQQQQQQQQQVFKEEAADALFGLLLRRHDVRAASAAADPTLLLAIRLQFVRGTDRSMRDRPDFAAVLGRLAKQLVDASSFSAAETVSPNLRAKAAEAARWIVAEDSGKTFIELN